jgi:hypothetical protein
MKSIIMFCVGFITGYVISKTRDNIPEEWDWEVWVYSSGDSTTANASGLK